MNKNRKKGSLIVEFLVIIPVFLLLAWSTLHIIFFVVSQSTMHQAAMDAARITSLELRGHQGPINTTSSTTQEVLIDKIRTKIHTSTKGNAMILLYRDEDFGHLSPDSVPIVIEPADKCQSVMDNDSMPSVICIYTDGNGAVSVDQEQIVVKIKGKLRIIGSMIPTLKDKFYVKGTGSAVKDQAERFQYITP